MTALPPPIACVACGGRRVHALLPCHGFGVLRCLACGQMWSVPRETVDGKHVADEREVKIRRRSVAGRMRHARVKA